LNIDFILRLPIHNKKRYFCHNDESLSDGWLFNNPLQMADRGRHLLLTT